MHVKASIRDKDVEKIVKYRVLKDETRLWRTRNMSIIQVVNGALEVITTKFE